MSVFAADEWAGVAAGLADVFVEPSGGFGGDGYVALVVAFAGDVEYGLLAVPVSDFDADDFAAAESAPAHECVDCSGSCVG